jgi:diguanylate cyclase
VALIGPTRARDLRHEARLAHLACGIALRGRGEHAAARRELTAAVELSADGCTASQRLIFQYELALLGIAEHPVVAGDVRAALRSQATYLWNIRTERLAMLRQARRRVELEAERVAADEAAQQDALTGLGNRRRFDAQLAAADDGSPLVLLLVDVDRFKDINDRYSHGAGDRVLREVAAVLRSHCRPGDLAVRFGGDEFAVFLRGDLAAAARIGERIRRAVATYRWHDIAAGLRVTISMGAAPMRGGMDGAALFDAADVQLYAAKRGGRDQLAAA